MIRKRTTVIRKRTTVIRKRTTVIRKRTTVIRKRTTVARLKRSGQNKTGTPQIWRIRSLKTRGKAAIILKTKTTMKWYAKADRTANKQN